MGHSREPIENTCPDIDKLIKGLYEINNLIKGYHRLDEVDDLKELIDNIENILYHYDDKLEELRRANDELRSWGIEEAEQVDKLESQLNAVS